MSEQNTVILNGNDLTVDEIVAIGVGDKQVAVVPAVSSWRKKSLLSGSFTG